MANNGSRYHAEVKVTVEGNECRVNVFADTLDEVFADIGTICATFPRAWAPAPAVDPSPQPAPQQPARRENRPMATNGRPVPPRDSRPPPDSAGPVGELPTCVHCGQWDGMELITFPDKKTGEVRSAFKCQSCSKWHYPKQK